MRRTLGCALMVVLGCGADSQGQDDDNEEDGTADDGAFTPAGGLKIDRCLTGDETLLDLLPDDFGNGAPVRCDYQGGSSNGSMPDGISLNPDTCQVEGSIETNRLGTWVFIVRGKQGGTELFAPYCVTQDAVDFSYAIDVSHSGLISGATEPIVREFQPDAPVEVGADGDPLITVTHPPSCDTGCYFGFTFGLGGSAFDPTTFSLPDQQTVFDDGGSLIGFSHELSISGPPVPKELRARPWVQTVAINYCLASDPNTCNGSDATTEHGDGSLQISLLMLPSEG